MAKDHFEALWGQLKEIAGFPEETKTKEMFREMVEALTLFSRKQNDYSSANIYIAGEYGLFTRLTDKYFRLFSHYRLGKEMRNESLDDTFRDMVVYSLIALLWRRGKWTLTPEEKVALGSES